MTATALIDVAAFQDNLRLLARVAHPTPVMAMLKADAYGHGMLALAQPALDAGATALGVLEITAALALRDAGVEARLFAWLHGSGADFAAAAARRIDVGISTLTELEAALVALDADTRPLAVHLKIDTGLHRNGASVQEWPVLVARAVDAEQRGRLRIEGIWSHLADASAEDDAIALAEFRAAVATAEGLGARPALLHLGASSAGIYLPEARFDIVRFGIAAYGLSPFDDRTSAEIGVRPVMTIVAKVTHADGESTRIGIGWGHGLHATAQGRAEVLVRGRRARLLEIGPDSSRLDVSDVEIGDEVIVFGDGSRGEPTAADWAEWAETIGDEIVTRISPRVERVWRRRGA